MRLEGKSVVITGAARGVGGAAARVMAGVGASVTCVDREADSLRGTVERIVGAGGVASSVVADISTAAGNEAAIAHARECYGGLDALLANAAIVRFGLLSETSEADWDLVHATNLRGAFLGARAALPALQERGGGVILFTSSVLGFVGDPIHPAYGATKGGLRALCRSIAVAHGSEGIRCNTICPGDVSTEMFLEFIAEQEDPEEARAKIDAHYPLGRIATPEDVGRVAAFLVSEDARYITGTDILVDGGLLATCYS